MKSFPTTIVSACLWTALLLPPLVFLPWLPDVISVQKAFALRILLILACGAAVFPSRAEKKLDPIFAVLLILNIGWLMIANAGAELTPEGRLLLMDRVLSFLAIAIMALYAPQDSSMKRGLAALVVVLWIVSLWGFFNRYLPRSLAPLPHREIIGAFSHPNVFAQYAAPIIPLSVGLALASKDRSRLMFNLLVFITLLIPFLLAYSRGAILASIIGSGLLVLAVLLWSKNRKKVWISAIAACVAAIVSLGIFWGFDQPGKKRERVLEEVAEISDIKSSSFRGRLALWRQGMEVALEYPAFGSGVGQMRAGLAAKRRQDDPESKFMHKDVHQDYIQIAAEYGFPALILYLALLARLFCLGLKTVGNLAPDDPQRIYRLALMAGALVFCLHGFVSFPLSRCVPRMYAMCFLGWAAAPMIVAGEAGGARKYSLGKFAFALIVIFAFLSILFYPGVIREGRSMYDFWKVRSAFIKKNTEDLGEACESILDNQASGLTRRLRCLALTGRKRGEDILLRDLTDMAADYPGHYGIAFMRASAFVAAGEISAACREAARGAAIWPRNPRWGSFVRHVAENAADERDRALCRAVEKTLNPRPESQPEEESGWTLQD